jgi:hypothetical protein
MSAAGVAAPYGAEDQVLRAEAAVHQPGLMNGRQASHAPGRQRFEVGLPERPGCAYELEQ